MALWAELQQDQAPEPPAIWPKTVVDVTGWAARSEPR
jgi:hypothetical protein